MKKKRILFLIIIILIVYFLISLRKTEKNSEIKDYILGSDSEAPVIELNNEIQIIAKDDEFVPKIKVTDDIDGDLTDKVTIEGTVDTTTVGTYDITYKVSDSSGNTAEKEQKVEVRNKLENGLPVLMYHFFYSKDDPNYAGKKPDNNVLMVEKFSEQMDYLVEEDFYFPTWQEVEDYIDGKINLPEKSVVLTDDDGNHTFFALAVPVTEEKKIPITSFIITGAEEERLKEKYNYVDFESHSDDMHKSGENGKGAIVNWSHDKIVQDLESSKNKIKEHTGNDVTIFCYPFGHYNDTAINALKDADFKLAFTVEGGRVKPSMDKFKLPRVRINGSTSLEEFKKSVK